MINANEARAKATEILTQGKTAELQEIEKEINVAVKKGEYQIQKGGTLSRAAIKFLSEKGYKIYDGQHYNESYYYIQW